MTAKVRDEYISVLTVENFKGLTVATTACRDFNNYLDLPDAIEVGGKVLGKTGWNSDNLLAYYRSDGRLGKVVVR